MSNPAVIDEQAVEDLDGTEEHTPTSAQDLEQVKSLLLWLRKWKFSAGVIVVGSITMHGVQDHAPRPTKGGSVDGHEYPAWMTEHPDLIAQLEARKSEEP